MVPPESLWTMVGGPSAFVEQGEHTFKYLVETFGLTPGSAVLDIGCGLGKHAMHFATYLKPPGLYEGFDVEPISIRWCNTAIHRRHPHARFRRIAVQSGMYNPKGARQASHLRFPYPSDRFDLVFLGSVFTHMFRDDVRHYLGEIARVLKPGGVCVATFFLLNEEKRRGIQDGEAAFSFEISHRGSWIEGTDPPEGAVAQEESDVLAMLDQVGLSLVLPRRYGSWARMSNHDQDFVFCRKPA